MIQDSILFSSNVEKSFFMTLVENELKFISYKDKSSSVILPKNGFYIIFQFLLMKIRLLKILRRNTVKFINS